MRESRTKGGSTTSEIVNGVNRKALMQIREKMIADDSVGLDAKVCVKAVWEKGMARTIDGKLVSHPPAEVALGYPQYPNMNDYCPLVSTGCFSLVYMIQAAARDFQFDRYETHMCADADFSCLYQQEKAMANPWRNGLTLDVRITGPSSQDEMDMLGIAAKKHCPAVEIMEREFPVTTIVTGKQVKIENKREYYDMDKYRALANSKKPVIVKQNANGIWYCKSQSKTYPGALMRFEFGFGLLEGKERQIPLSFDKPIGSGKYANPMQACFFGGLSTHMHTIALLLYAKGYKIDRMTGSANALMNKRAVMGIEIGTYIFSNGVTLNIEVETDAPPEVVDQVQFEAEGRSPAMMNWGNALPLEMRILKETGYSYHAGDDDTEQGSVTSSVSSKGMNLRDSSNGSSRWESKGTSRRNSEAMSLRNSKRNSRWKGFGDMFKGLRKHG